MASTLGECDFCHMMECTGETGELLKTNDEEITAHFNCMLYSPGVTTNNTTDPSKDLGGFNIPSVRKEIQRGKRTKCSVCSNPGATVGCDRKECRKSFHYACAIKDGAKITENKEKEQYLIHCRKHCENRASAIKPSKGLTHEDDSDSSIFSSSSSSSSSGIVDSSHNNRKRKHPEHRTPRKKGKVQRDLYAEEKNESSFKEEDGCIKPDTAENLLQDTTSIQGSCDMCNTNTSSSEANDEVTGGSNHSIKILKTFSLKEKSDEKASSAWPLDHSGTVQDYHYMSPKTLSDDCLESDDSVSLLGKLKSASNTVLERPDINPTKSKTEGFRIKELAGNPDGPLAGIDFSKQVTILSKFKHIKEQMFAGPFQEDYEQAFIYLCGSHFLEDTILKEMPAIKSQIKCIEKQKEKLDNDLVQLKCLLDKNEDL